jgi:hypothetical protein
MTDETPTEDDSPPSLDFTSTIASLTSRARRARRRSVIAMTILFAGVYAIAIFLIYEYKSGTRFEIGSIEVAGWSRWQPDDDRSTVERLFARRIRQTIEKLDGKEPTRSLTDVYGRPLKDKLATEPFREPPPEVAQALRANLKDELSEMELAVKIADAGKHEESLASQLVPTIATAVFSLGAVAFLVLLIQIAVVFIRYHLRIAELYDAQADAFRSSGGSPKLAHLLLAQLSPNEIEFGRVPSTIYEKALEAIIAATRKSAQGG